MHTIRKFSCVLGISSVFLVWQWFLTEPAVSAPSVFPKGVTVYDSTKAYQGYTLFRANTPGTIYAIDMDGKVVNTWQSHYGTRLGPMVRPLPNGHILVEAGYKQERFILEMDWQSNVVWKFKMPDPKWWINHDFERLPNGNTLVLTANLEMLPAIAPREVKEERIFEVNPSGHIVWMWRTSEHFDELGISQEGRRMIYDGSAPQSETDIFHTNSIQSIPPNPSGDRDRRFAEGNILVSQRNTGLVFIIGKAAGNIVWNLHECLDVDATVKYPPAETVGQHHAKMIPRGLVGAGNILMFDNGGQSGYPPKWRSFSRVQEINPITCKRRWLYGARVQRNEGGDDIPQSLLSFFSVSRGSAQRLPNGNTLITEAEWQRIFEVTKKGAIVWEYIYPEEPNDPDNAQFFIYRGYRTDYSWPTGAVGPGNLDRFTW